MAHKYPIGNSFSFVSAERGTPLFRPSSSDRIGLLDSVYRTFLDLTGGPPHVTPFRPSRRQYIRLKTGGNRGSCGHFQRDADAPGREATGEGSTFGRVMTAWARWLFFGKGVTATPANGNVPSGRPGGFERTRGA